MLKTQRNATIDGVVRAGATAAGSLVEARVGSTFMAVANPDNFAGMSAADMLVAGQIPASAPIADRLEHAALC